MMLDRNVPFFREDVGTKIAQFEETTARMREASSVLLFFFSNKSEHRVRKSRFVLSFTATCLCFLLIHQLLIHVTCHSVICHFGNVVFPK